MLARIAWLACIVWAATAQPADAQAQLFAEDAPLAVIIEGPIRAITRVASRGAMEAPAALVLADGRRFRVTLSPRGVSRRDPRVCAFAPLLINFERAALRGTLFEGQNKLKLVTHCRPDARFAQMLALEHDIYRMYQTLTPLSFKVRALDVTYAEPERPPDRRFAFLIEDVDDMARRNGLVEITAGSAEIAVERFEPRATSVLALFQYMIGNLDWDYRYGPVGGPCCHNIKLVARQGATDGIIAVPYDFDFSGLVDAPYATPPPQVRVRSVRTRFFRGRCRHNGELAAAAALFQENRARMLAILANDPRLDEATRTRARDYIEAYFAILDDPARFQADIVRRCIR